MHLLHTYVYCIHVYLCKHKLYVMLCCAVEEETASELKETLEPKDQSETKTADSEVIADALLAVVGDGFAVEEGEEERKESDVPSAAPDKEQKEDGSQEEDAGVCVISLGSHAYMH